MQILEKKLKCHQKKFRHSCVVVFQTIRQSIILQNSNGNPFFTFKAYEMRRMHLKSLFRHFARLEEPSLCLIGLTITNGENQALIALHHLVETQTIYNCVLLT